MSDGEIVTLNRSEIRKMGLHKRLAGEIYGNIRLELFTSQIFHTSFLTERPIHIDIINSISEDSSLYRRNMLVEKYLTTLVPFLSDIDVADLIKLRNREQESFIVFRQSLNRAIDECRKSDEHLLERSAKEIYSDIIAPQLAKLDLRIRSAKKDLVKSTRRKALAWGGAISFGMYTGFIPSELAAVASIIGLSKIIADFLEMSMNKSDVTEFIKNEEMYFLWRIRELTKR